MSKLNRLTGQKKAYNIGGVELELSSRTLKHLSLLMDLSDEGKKGEAMQRLVFVTLKDAVPDATDDEINNFGMQYFKDLTEAIVDVNGLKNLSVSS